MLNLTVHSSHLTPTLWLQKIILARTRFRNQLLQRYLACPDPCSDVVFRLGHGDSTAPTWFLRRCSLARAGTCSDVVFRLGHDVTQLLRRSSDSIAPTFLSCSRLRLLRRGFPARSRPDFTGIHPCSPLRLAFNYIFIAFIFYYELDSGGFELILRCFGCLQNWFLRTNL
jgi:hypothetical protein